MVTTCRHSKRGCRGGGNGPATSNQETSYALYVDADAGGGNNVSVGLE